MTNKYRAVIIGTGKSVGNHLTAIRENAHRIELVAACDIDETRVRAICAEHQIPRWYTDVSAMLAAEQPDLVHIITPPATHRELNTQCLEAGAWVYCEKPLCASLAEFDTLTEIEERTGRYITTVFQWRFGSAAKHFKHLLQTQALGKPLVGICNTLWYRPHEYYRDAWRGRWKTEIGGPTATLGIHLMDLFLWLLGDWQEVYAMTATLDRDIEVEDISTALVRFESGVMATITNSVLSPRQESYLRFDLQRATLEVRALYRYNNDNWSISIPDNATDTTPLDLWKSIPNNLPGSHGMQLAEVLDSMDTNTRPPASGADARNVLEFVASMYKSAALKQPVQRGSITTLDPYYTAMNGEPDAIIT